MVMEPNIKLLDIRRDAETETLHIDVAIKVINPLPHFIVKLKAEELGVSEEKFVEAVNEFEKAYPKLVKFMESK
jgi:hypothetical protein